MNENEILGMVVQFVPTLIVLMRIGVTLGEVNQTLKQNNVMLNKHEEILQSHAKFIIRMESQHNIKQG